jgi:hypothetical protein
MLLVVGSKTIFFQQQTATNELLHSEEGVNTTYKQIHVYHFSAPSLLMLPHFQSYIKIALKMRPSHLFKLFSQHLSLLSPYHDFGKLETILWKKC